MPNFFLQRDIDATMLANVISARLTEKELPRNNHTQMMHNYFIIAERFSKKSGFYV
jgi:hypothetical protein